MTLLKDLWFINGIYIATDEQRLTLTDVPDKTVILDITPPHKIYVWNNEWELAHPLGEGGGPHTHPETDVVNLTIDLSGKLATGHTSDYNHNLIHANGLDHSNSLDHSNAHDSSPHAPSNAQKNSDITKAEIESKLTGEISSHTHAGGGGESETVVIATQTTANATTTLADATGLAFAALANSTYLIEGYIVWSASLATVGIKLSATGPATPTLMAGHFVTDAINGTPDSSSFNANNVTVTTSASAFTTDNIAALHCVLKTAGNAGNFQIRFAAETTGTVTIQIGSCLRYRKIA